MRVFRHIFAGIVASIPAVVWSNHDSTWCAKPTFQRFHSKRRNKNKDADRQEDGFMISKCMVTRIRQTAVLLVAFGGSWMAPTAHSQRYHADQILDQVEVVQHQQVLAAEGRPTPTKFVGLAAVRQTQLRACQSSNVNGLFCLDGQVVRHWPTRDRAYPDCGSPPAEAGTPFSVARTRRSACATTVYGDDGRRQVATSGSRAKSRLVHPA